MIKQILTSAVFAGVAVGFIAAMLQFWLVTPLLQESELYETGARIHFAIDGSTQSDAGVPFDFGDTTRHLRTIGFSVVAYAGYTFLLVACFALSVRMGLRLTPRIGLIWGLAGFLTLQLAPSMGLPPELPGAVAAEVETRQIWWMFTVLATGTGLALIAFGSNALAWGFAAALIALPHIIGAPALDTHFGVAPPELSAHLVARTLGVSAISWSLLGLIAAYIWTRTEEA